MMLLSWYRPVCGLVCMAFGAMLCLSGGPLL